MFNVLFEHQVKSLANFVDSIEKSMIDQIGAEEFLKKAHSAVVIDVRSPGEYSQGHIPGAVNIPLFDNEERAMVGILYKNSGREAAVLKGLDLAGPKMAGYVKALNEISRPKEVLVHCWRGGMRSENMSWLFSQAGYHVFVLEGGYKTFRRYIRSCFEQNARLFVLGGLTGSGKTEILHALGNNHEQFIDLEQIACHKGSVFGAFGQKPQPTTEQFENDLFTTWSGFDLAKPIWIEDESRAIGNVNIPDPLFEQMNHPAIMVQIECSREARVRRLVKEYSQFEKEDLKEAILKIRDKLGDRVKTACLALDAGGFNAVAEIVLDYYDKTYEHSIARRKGLDCHKIPILTDDPGATAQVILGYISSLQISSNNFPHATDLS